MNEALSAGSEIDAYCTKCRLDLGHTIIAMVGHTVPKVICNTCGSQHKYYPPKSEKEKSTFIKRRTVIKQRNGETVTVSAFPMRIEAPSAPQESPVPYNEPKKAVAKKTKPPKTYFDENQWRIEVLSKDVAHPLSYSPHDSYESGVIIKHPTFGLGLIKEVRPDNKIYVIFQSGYKILIANRPQPADTQNNPMA
jgi:hypothetical protein